MNIVYVVVHFNNNYSNTFNHINIVGVYDNYIMAQNMANIVPNRQIYTSQMFCNIMPPLIIPPLIMPPSPPPLPIFPPFFPK